MDRQTMQLEVKKALNETVLLSDGRYGYIISNIVEKSSGVEKWECHVCMRSLHNERAMLMHLSHPLHMNKMRAPHHPPSNFHRKITKDDLKENPDNIKIKTEEKAWVATDVINAGEPIPPGMEDVVKKVCQIQETLDNHPGPLIGIEYIVELVSEDGSEPKYICLLCEKKGDPRSVMVHLCSHNHDLRYISCFFRTAGNALNMIPKVKENRRGLNLAVRKIAEQIEKKFGRLKPMLALTETFAQQKNDILRSIEEKEHFRETPDNNYLQYCTLEKIKEFSALADSEIIKPKTFSANNINPRSERQESELEKAKDVSGKGVLSKESKLSFSIGKPERSLGRNNRGSEPNITSSKEAPPNNIDAHTSDDEVIFVGALKKEIEVQSMSSISSTSDEDDLRISDKYSERRRRRSSRSESRNRSRGRHLSPHGRRPFNRASPHSYRSRYRSRSRSRSRTRYVRDRRDVDRNYSRDRRSRSYDRGRYDSRRYRRSISSDRDRRRLSPYSIKHTRSPARSPPHRPKILDKSPEPKKIKAPSDYEVKMDEYRAKVHELEVDMDKKLKYYRERPEKHPQYSDEWKAFWNSRYKELQQSGKDPTGYDFKPEWIVFWDERVKQLHEEEVACKKEDLKCFLPKENKGPSSDLQDISPPTSEDEKEVTITDLKNTWKALTGSDIKAPDAEERKSPTPGRGERSWRSTTPGRCDRTWRSPSPWEDRYSGARERSRKGGSTYVADPPIVHCLRMLSVIEQQLGSLGPKALDLLSKAILMEKVKSNESMKLLQDTDVHIFFETVKEKIRGQLIAGIVVRYLVNSCRSLITTIESMLAANPLKPKSVVGTQPKPSFTPLQPEPVKVAGVGLVNKMAVAQQIAEILVAQGRTDVSQQQLEELINAVVGIASTTNTNVDQPAPTFISQLNIQNSTAKPHINELLSNLISSAQKSIGASPAVPSPASVSTTSLQVSSSKTPEEEKPAPEPQLPVLQVPSTLISSQSSLKAFSEAVSAAKATASEQALSTPTPSLLTPMKEKVLFPIEELFKTPIKDKEKNSLDVSDDELKERLIKFKSLSRDEQQSLIALLKDLESNEPERVEKLRKYVTLGLSKAPDNTTLTKNEPGSSVKSSESSGRLSPFSSRAGGVNPGPEEKRKLVSIASDSDEDDDDYSVEDVYKSVSEKLKKNEAEGQSTRMLNQSETYDKSSGEGRGDSHVVGHPDGEGGNTKTGWPKGMYLSGQERTLGYTGGSNFHINPDLRPGGHSTAQIGSASSSQGSTSLATGGVRTAPPSYPPMGIRSQSRQTLVPGEQGSSSYSEGSNSHVIPKLGSSEQGNQSLGIGGTPSYTEGITTLGPELSGMQIRPPNFSVGSLPQGSQTLVPGGQGALSSYNQGNPVYNNQQYYQNLPPFNNQGQIPYNYNYQRPEGQQYYNYRQY